MTMTNCTRVKVVTNIATFFAQTENATNTVAALHLVPAYVGNALGAFIGGLLIKRYSLSSFQFWTIISHPDCCNF